MLIILSLDLSQPRYTLALAFMIEHQGDTNSTCDNYSHFVTAKILSRPPLRVPSEERLPLTEDNRINTQSETPRPYDETFASRTHSNRYFKQNLRSRTSKINRTRIYFRPRNARVPFHFSPTRGNAAGGSAHAHRVQFPI